MRIVRRKSGVLRALMGVAGIAGLALWGPAPISPASAEDALIKYNGNTRDYWEHPPADWFMGDETAQQHGTRPYPGQPLPTPHDELVGLVKDNIQLPPGFHIEVLASNIDCARQMVFGSDGTLYVGCWTEHVYALQKHGDKWDAKVIIKGLRQPTGIGFYNGNLYVSDIDKIYRYKDIAKNLDNPKGEVVYSDFPPYTSHGWKYAVAGLVLYSGRAALQRLHDSFGHGAISPREPRRGPVGSGCTRPAQQRRRRRRPAQRSTVVLRERPRLDGRQHPVGQAQPLDQVWRALRLSVLPPGRHPGSEIRHGPQV
jgi:hypothetical protein